ncbi:MAG: DUF433 domain-containing protein [Proteobacteria bacterium]|nr:DUF433 domain-containing protein [Pseudomonadota bacterium]
MESLLKRITIDPEICHGKPCIRGLRYTVEMILELLSSDMEIADILQDYEDLEKNDIKACLMFAAKLSQIKSIHKLAS